MWSREQWNSYYRKYYYKNRKKILAKLKEKRDLLRQKIKIKCSNCGKVFTPFTLNSKYCCKKCRSQHYYKVHKENSLRYMHEYYFKNKERISEYKRQWWLKKQASKNRC